MGQRDRAADHPILTVRTLLRFLPAPFWCYMLPMLASSAGWLPRESPLYTFASRQILPVCLALLLIGTDFRPLARMGPLATRIMLAGSAGTILGGGTSFFLYRRWLPAGSEGTIGALAGSWIGGSANLLAVKEALGVPDSLIAPIILVDALIAYGWMALLIAASGWQTKWNRFVTSGSHGSWEMGVGPKAGTVHQGDTPHRGVSPCGLSPGLGFAIFLAVFVSLFAKTMAARLPTVAGLNSSTWTVLLVTTAALALSATPLRRLGEGTAPALGKLLLYLLLITIGARANIQAVAEAPLFLALGVTWILIHGAVLLAAGAFWRAPLGLIATASQANIGGPISAPIVGATYSPQLAGIGLLMAILGNILGTYLGLLTAWALRLGSPGS